MRTKLLRCRDDVTVQLVYSSTLEEYRQVLDALGGAAPAVANGESDSVAAGSRPRSAAYVITTAQQRHLWGLPDLTVSGLAVPVDEARALDLLHDAVVNPDRAAELFPGRSPEVVSALSGRSIVPVCPVLFTRRCPTEWPTRWVREPRRPRRSLIGFGCCSTCRGR